jgi:phosphotransferase system enzyme I (PtsI)
LTILKGEGVSPGAAAGKIFLYEPFSVDVEERFLENGAESEKEFARYAEVKAAAAGELEILRDNLEKDDPEKAKIFTAHLDILDDPVINEEIETGIKSERQTGQWAVWKSYETFIGMVKKAKNALIAERAADFEDVRKRLLRIWFGVEKADLGSPGGQVILAARDLFPSDTASLDKNKVLAIITEAGSFTSHSAIIARSYGIPAVLGVAGLLEALKSSATADGIPRDAAVDAESGEVFLDPDERRIAEFTLRREKSLKDREENFRFLDIEAFTKDRVRIELGLNIGKADDRELEGAAYTDFSGLFRTEFLFMGRAALPDEDEQYAVYRKVLERYGKRPVTLRTLDIGGDKPLSSMELPKEGNPFLGNRALRFCFNHPDIFKTQLRAAIRASAHGNLWLMFPMAGSIDDVRKAKSYVDEIRAEFRQKKIPFDGDFKTGIMIEIPAIAMIADRAAREVDFASIGSNDLCQYLCAADRVNPAVAEYYQRYHPGLFRMIRDTVKAFNDAGKPISICGELGADALPLLIGLGLRKLSMGFALVAPAKRILAGLTVREAEELAAKAMDLNTAGEIRALLTEGRLKQSWI